MSKCDCRHLSAFALLLLLSIATLNGAEPLWRRADALPQNVPEADRWIRPQRASVVHLNHASLRETLNRAPREFTAAARNLTEMSLPMPNGTLSRFRIFESPIMAPELAAKFPDIKTYCGQGVDDPSATVRFDITPSGLHAQILSPSGAVYIDPYRRGDAVLHQSYYKRDYHRAIDGFRCLTAGGDEGGFRPAAGDAAAPGNLLRTYRLAVAATGEYTQFQGGTVAAGMAAIVTAINRVDGIYETELAIRLVLVANNNLIVFTDAATDPYTNNDPLALLTQNQSTIDSIIGGANYDVGHVFSTGGGGLSQVAVVCRSGAKAESETGLSSPIGDAFYVDFVAHEIGHEFGAHHTFNGLSGNCGGAQRTASTAYEPGSGTTIMAYAGICGADNLQAHSDPFFHFISFSEIQLYVTAGLGKDCAVTTATGNTAPTVGAGPDFTIPKGTPFTLTATGSDPNGDPVTYCWEERDLGVAQLASAPDNGSSPIFRSFAPTTNTSRTFPKLFDILNHTMTLGEQLPMTARTLNFRVTARDNHFGGGGISSDDMQVTVVGTAGPFQVTSPNTAVLWSGTQTVTWDVAGTTNSPINAATVDLLLSTNGGASFPIVLAANTPNDGSENVVLPNLTTSFARIKVRATGNIFFDISDANFSIATFTPTPQVALDTAALISENCAPANGVLDPDEIVTMNFALKNTGTGDTTNLVATLLASGGIVPLSGPQSYGGLVARGAAIARPFSFLATGACGSNVLATLQLQDGARSFGVVARPLAIGVPGSVTNSFANTGLLAIPSRNAASPYPSTIVVSGLTGAISKVTVTLTNLSHAQPDDLDVLLVGPGGQSVLLMSDVGGATTANNVTLVFDDAAANFLPDSGPLISGTWKPTNIGVDESFFSPAPAGPYGAALSLFNGQFANGTWSLYVFDDTNPNSGSIASGWRLTFVTQSAFLCCMNTVLPSLDISDASVVEGNSGTTNVQFALTLSRPSGQPVTVNFATSDGSAVAASDYVATNGTVQFNPGQTNRSLSVAVLGDILFETNETFAVTLSSPVNAILARTVGVGTIVDDEIRISLVPLAGLGVQVQFNTLAGRDYRVERTDQLSATNLWLAVPGATLVFGTGDIVQVLDTNAVSQPQRFYRVRWLEP